MRSLVLVLAVMLIASNARAVAEVGDADPFVPGAGRFGLAVATGVPFLVMSEVSLGVTDYAALGVLGGTTPIVSGFGIRPRAALPIATKLRLLVSAPIIYYPPHDRADAWWLARPSLSIDAQPLASLHVALGVGIVSVASQQSLFGSDQTSSAVGPYGGSSVGQVDGPKTWETLNLLASQSISTRSHVFMDATGVFDGFKLARSDWIGGPPFIVFLGVGTAL